MKAILVLVHRKLKGVGVWCTNTIFLNMTKQGKSRNHYDNKRCIEKNDGTGFDGVDEEKGGCKTGVDTTRKNQRKQLIQILEIK